MLIVVMTVGANSIYGMPAPSLPENALNVPLIPQATPYSCGPAALLSILYFWGHLEDTEGSLYSPLGTTKKNGTEPYRIAEFANRRGFEAAYLTDVTLEQLKSFWMSGFTVIIEFQAWQEIGEKKSLTPWSEDWDDGHYAVLVGMDSNYVYFMDPSVHASYGYVSIPDFLDRWHDVETRGLNTYRRQHPIVAIRGQAPMRKFPGALVEIK